ncbi:hypothetical protein [Photobacterium sanguinicancri]|uniref:hypothetical protein n=1 Tax=Photobacterium sanguinicancri TaxID=875932 RepID=UPI0026E4534D|nr:hypothetical protein [Photobacterium sanguinicancri]MDO6497351.1 hypothetical protein [Photobacterium sanguinicancri]
MKTPSHLNMPFISPHTRLKVLEELERAQQLEELNVEVVGKSYADGVFDALLWVMGKIPAPSE